MELSTVPAFLAVDLLLVLTPGADWAYAIAAGLRGRFVLPAVLGLVAGYAGCTLLAVAGLVVLVASSKGLLMALTVVGAAYLVWLGLGVLARPAAPGAAETLASSPGRVVLEGAGISGLNPKAVLLFVSLFPQFVEASAGWPVGVQTAVFGVLHMALYLTVYLAVGVSARLVPATRPGVARAVSRVSGAMMIGMGGVLLADRLAGG